MRLILPFVAILLSLAPDTAGNASPDFGGATRADLIVERLSNANRFRDHVMVVAHRAGWKTMGKPVRAENSRAAIDSAVEMGVEMVELDIRRSRDGVLVVMHDATLDRTTTCKGEVSAHTLEQLRACRLMVEGSGIVTDEPVPTLAEMLRHARGRILINIDNKLEPEDLPEIAAQARAADMANGVLLKMAIWNDDRLQRARQIRDRIGPDIAFMPILADDAVRDPSFMEQVAGTVGAPATEMVVWHKEPDLPQTTDGGALFTARARAVAIRTNAHLWINTYPITDRPEGMVAGGRGDGTAWEQQRPDDSYGFWIERGATIIQTDEPEAVIGWLDARGLRRSYSVTN